MVTAQQRAYIQADIDEYNKRIVRLEGNITQWGKTIRKLQKRIKDKHSLFLV